MKLFHIEEIKVLLSGMAGEERGKFWKKRGGKGVLENARGQVEGEQGRNEGVNEKCSRRGL